MNYAIFGFKNRVRELFSFHVARWALWTRTFFLIFIRTLYNNRISLCIVKKKLNTKNIYYIIFFEHNLYKLSIFTLTAADANEPLLFTLLFIRFYIHIFSLLKCKYRKYIIMSYKQKMQIFCGWWDDIDLFIRVYLMAT